MLPSLATAQLVFVDRAAQTGTWEWSFGRGSAFTDLDGDGLLDLVAGNAGMPSSFYRQLPDHTFERANVAWGIADDSSETFGVLVADFDQDGDPDVLEVNGAFLLSEPNRLLRNDLATTGRFTDVTASSGALAASERNFGGTAADYDRDGDLDLFLTRTSGACQLLRNDGGLHFTDVSMIAGISHDRVLRHCGQGDYDRDGWIDFAAGAKAGANLLYHNLGDGSFEEVAASAGVDSPDDNFGMVFADFDADGWLDLYVPKYYGAPQGRTSVFLRNRGDGTFEDVSGTMGISGQTDMGHQVGDLDADGFPDVYVGTGSPRRMDDDVLWRIEPDGAGGLRAEDVSVSSGITSVGPTRCHGMAFGDYDDDGDIDVFANFGGPSDDSTTLEGSALWQNQGNGNGWTALLLRGVRSNRDGVGTHAIARTASGREVHRERAIGRGFGNTDAPPLHFGLGADSSAELVEVHWPSGIVQTHYAPVPSRTTLLWETGLLAPERAAVGSSFEVLVAGAASHQVFLFASATLCWTPLPELHGVWRLERPFDRIARDVTGADGRGRIVLQVPTDPGLAGTTFHLQAGLFAPRSGAVTDVHSITIE